MKKSENCPSCGEISLHKCEGTYAFRPPPNIPGGIILVDGAEWEHCVGCGEDILHHHLSTRIEIKAKNRSEYR